MGNEIVNVGAAALLIGILAFRWLLQPLHPVGSPPDADRPAVPAEPVVDLPSSAQSSSLPAGLQPPVRIQAARVVDDARPDFAGPTDGTDVVAACA